MFDESYQTRIQILTERVGLANKELDVTTKTVEDEMLPLLQMLRDHYLSNSMTDRLILFSTEVWYKSRHLSLTVVARRGDITCHHGLFRTKVFTGYLGRNGLRFSRLYSKKHLQLLPSLYKEVALAYQELLKKKILLAKEKTAELKEVEGWLRRG